jgi:hypothetical protein
MRKGSHRIDSTVCYGNRTSPGDPEELKTQVEVIRDVMLSASDCDTWLTLREIAEMTRFGEASISAQLRHLRKPIFGGFRVQKRRRCGAGEIMVVRERRMAANPVGNGAGIIGPRRANSRNADPAWQRAYGLRPGNWEYRVARG